MTAKVKAPRLTEQQCAALATKAHLAGMDAGGAARPAPMYVVEHANPWDDNSRVVRRYAPVEGGVCGYVCVRVRPGTSTFARYARRHLGWRAAYYGGTEQSVWEFGQSLERKTAYGRAYAKVLNEAGLTCYVDARMD